MTRAVRRSARLMLCGAAPGFRAASEFALRIGGWAGGAITGFCHPPSRAWRGCLPAAAEWRLAACVVAGIVLSAASVACRAASIALRSGASVDGCCQSRLAGVPVRRRLVLCSAACTTRSEVIAASGLVSGGAAGGLDALWRRDASAARRLLAARGWCCAAARACASTLLPLLMLRMMFLCLVLSRFCGGCGGAEAERTASKGDMTADPQPDVLAASGCKIRWSSCRDAASTCCRCGCRMPAAAGLWLGVGAVPGAGRLQDAAAARSDRGLAVCCAQLCLLPWLTACCDCLGVHREAAAGK